MYTKSIDNEDVIISLYIDDMLIFCTCMNVVSSTKCCLASKFDMKDMGKTRVILSIKIIKRDNDILLTKEHYVEKLLKKLGHFDVTPVNIPYNDNT